MSSNATLDRFYAECERRDPSFTNSGIDADKPGYHNKRDELIRDGRPSDYSISQVAADARGRGTVSAGIDLKLPDGPNSKMTLYTGRLKAAALARDERLWLYGGPVLREFIGTVDGENVYCYVLTGGVPLGVGKDSGEDPGRDESHLWHIHLSWIRQYAEDWAAMDAVLSVMFGESLSAWRARTGRGNDVGSITDPEQLQMMKDTNHAVGSIPSPTEAEPNKRVPLQVFLPALRDEMRAAFAALAAGNEELEGQIAAAQAAAEQQLDEAAAALTTEVNEVAGEVIGSLPAHTYDRAIETLIAAGGEDWVANLGRAIAERFPAGGE